MNKFLCIFFVIMILGTQSILSQNDDQDDDNKHPILTDKYLFGVGVFYPSKTFQIKAEGSVQSDVPDDDFEFGAAFDLDDSEATFFGGFEWRFAKKWKLGFEYFGLSNKNEARLKEDIEWEDFIFKEGTGVTGGVSLKIYRAFVGRIFTTGQKHEFGGGLGAHTMSVKAFIEGDAYVNDEDFSFERSSKSITLPLPNLGLWYYFTPTNKLALTARFDMFAISINEYSGSLWDVTPGIQYQFFEHIGAALNYRYIKLNAGFDSSDWTGDVNVIFQGPSFTITGNF